MSTRPRCPLGPCPNCGREPDLRIRGIFKLRARMECKCGVSGAWTETDLPDSWHNAARGWPFKWKMPHPAPKPMR